MTTQSKIYQKHQSFETFSSSINTDLEAQKKRVISVLQGEVDQKYKEVSAFALADLLKSRDEDIQFKVTQYIADELSKIEDVEIPRYVYHRYRYDVYPKQYKLDQYPPYLQIEPTSVCNFRCVFCYQTDKEFTTKKNGYMGSMSLEMFKDIVDQVEGQVDFISLASRGEPLICPDIDAMLEYTVGKFLGLKINTNASMLNEKHAHAILTGGINTIVFSADAAVEPLYSQLRVNGDLEKVLANIRMFMDIKKKHYPKSKIITRVSGVKVNEEQSMDVMKNLWEDLVDQISFVKYNPWENVYESPMSKMTTPCSDLWRRMFVWYDGKVNPCDTDYKSALLVGTKAEETLTKLWRSEAYESLRKNHIDQKRGEVAPCQRCVVV